MATQKVTYKEPKSYFTPAMLKAVKEYDKKQAAEAKKESEKSNKKSK